MLGYIANARKLTKTTNYDKLKAYTYIDLQFIREKLVKKKKKPFAKYKNLVCLTSILSMTLSFTCILYLLMLRVLLWQSCNWQFCQLHDHQIGTCRKDEIYRIRKCLSLVFEVI